MRIKKLLPATLVTLGSLFTETIGKAQDATGAAGSGSPDWFADHSTAIVVGLLGFILLILVLGITLLGDRLIKLSAYKLGKERDINEEDTDEKYSILPTLKPYKKPARKAIKITRGFDIIIKGSAPEVLVDQYESNTYALKPTDFEGMAPIPKVIPSVGDEVKAGDPVLYDKKRPEIIFTAPVSGEIAEIRRGAKRRITEVVILADKEISYKDFGSAKPLESDRKDILGKLVESGAFTHIRQRPYDIVPDPNQTPKSIFISCFDSAPLGIDYDFIVAGQQDDFQAGIDALGKLTDGEVHLGLNNKKEHSPVFLNTLNVKRHWFEGPHPAGNVGIQIHHIDPIGKGDVVWHVDPQDVIFIGRLFNKGIYDTRKMVACVGPEILQPAYYLVHTGASIENMIKDNLRNDHVRYISGDVLSGRQIQRSGYVGFYDNQISVIEEGDDYEFMGWLMPSYARPSISPTFLSFIFHGEEHEVNTNSHGEERAFVITGLYEKVLPMDIYPMQLLKAIKVQDFDRMEGLGIYEVSEEDFALCEFVCPSKQPIQQIIHDGLTLMREQG